MPAVHEQFVSMSTSRDQGGAVLYVVSRSGKILRNHEEHQQRSRRFVDGDYFEGELEGWIFWGSNEGSGSGRHDGDHRFRRHQDVGYFGGNTSFIGKPFGSGRVTWSAKLPMVEWGRETDSIQDFFSYIDWTQSSWPFGRRNGSTARRRHHVEAGACEGAADFMFEACESVPASLKPHGLFRSEWERWHRMEQSYKIGLAQVAILQKSDIGSRWEPGTRELAARWAAWLLKMLRRTRSRPLQHLLFTMFSAVLPVICCSLVREQWTRVPDEELFRSVDIVWRALEKSHSCFTPAQWEILQERLVTCRKMQTKLESLTGRCSPTAVPENQEDSLCGERLKSEMLNPPCRVSHDTYQVCTNSRDEKFSNVLLKSEGVSALVKRALREKLSARQATHMDVNGSHSCSGGPGRIVSLVCPISKKRIKVPARGRDCKHLSSFDLDAFLEDDPSKLSIAAQRILTAGHAKNERQRSDSLHKQKKPKLDKGAWCCPTCGADATWPQIVVDRVLLRILEVVPAHMPQVCLLPNGRWRVVWSPAGLDLGQNDAKLTTVALYIPFKSTLEDEIYGLGQAGELRHDTFKAINRCLGYQQSFGCHELQILHKAYKAWKDEVDHQLSRGSNAEQSKLQRGPKSTHAVWTDDHNSSADMIGQPCSLQLIDRSGPEIRVIGENSESVNGAKADARIAVVKEVARILDAENPAETDVSRKIRAGAGATEIASASKVILGASPVPEGMTTKCDRTQLRIGLHKSRPKQMAKKT